MATRRYIDDSTAYKKKCIYLKYTSLNIDMFFFLLLLHASMVAARESVDDIDD